MLDIVVYLLDEQFKDEISEAFQEKNHVVHFTDKPKEVVQLCKQEFVDLILVWLATIENVEDLLTVLNSKKLSHLPVVAVLTSPDQTSAMLQLPVAGVISIPSPKEEFFSIIEQTVGEVKGVSKLLQGRFWQGKLEEFALLDLIQMVEMSARDAMMSISYLGHSGQVYFSYGKIIRASFRNLEGMEALKKLTCLTKADFQVNFTQVKPEYSLGLENSEIFNQLTKHLNLQQGYAEKLPDFRIDLKSFSKDFAEEANEIRKQILELCQNGESIYELLVVMNADNLEILQNVEELIKQGKLLEQTEFSELVREKSGKKGIASFWGSVSGFLRKESKEENRIQMYVPEQEEEEEAEKIEFSVSKNGLGRDEFEKFEKFLEDL